MKSSVQFCITGIFSSCPKKDAQSYHKRQPNHRLPYLVFLTQYLDEGKWLGLFYLIFVRATPNIQTKTGGGSQPGTKTQQFPLLNSWLNKFSSIVTKYPCKYKISPRECKKRTSLYTYIFFQESRREYWKNVEGLQISRPYTELIQK